MRFPVASLLALIVAFGPGVAAGAGSSAGTLAAQLPTEDARCNFLIGLCRAALVTIERAQGTPWSGRTDALIFKQEGEARLAVEDARSAARAIKERSGGRRPWCLDAPVCAFLGE